MASKPCDLLWKYCNSAGIFLVSIPCVLSCLSCLVLNFSSALLCILFFHSFSQNVGWCEKCLSHVMESDKHSLFPTGDLEALKKQNFTMKEGVDYRVKIHFKVRWKFCFVFVSFCHTFTSLHCGYERFLIYTAHLFLHIYIYEGNVFFKIYCNFLRIISHLS